MKNTKSLFLASATAVSALTSSVQADDKLSGTLSFDLNSHFISYGADVWADGDSPEGTFNPSLSIDYAINDNWTLNMGAWLDVNDNGAGNPSFETRETDVWIGLGYSSGIYSASVTYQSWQYAGDVEDILDIGLSLDTFLSPSLTLHHRLSSGGAAAFNGAGIQTNGFSGTMLVGGLEHTFELSEKFSLTVPVAIGVALDKFHTTESGFAYSSLGLQGSYAVSDVTSLNFGVTYYNTDSEVTGNADAGFLTYNAGVSFSF